MMRYPLVYFPEVPRMGKMYNNLECRIYHNLDKLSKETVMTKSQIMDDYFSRISNIHKAYGNKYKGRESHILVLAYRGVEQYAKQKTKKDLDNNKNRL